MSKPMQIPNFKSIFQKMTEQSPEIEKFQQKAITHVK